MIIKTTNRGKKLGVLILVIITLPLAIYLSLSKTSFFSDAFGTEANIVVAVDQPTGRRSGAWRNLAQGGEESGGMLLPVVDQVSLLELEYVRLDHIYDFYDVVSRGKTNELVFSWEKLDSEILAILDSGAKPFLVLSYMPRVISSGEEINLPNNWGDWEIVVQKTIEHFSGVDGLAIEDVYYEVWNEPDLFGDFKTYGKKNYYDLYFHSERGASKAQNTLKYKLGGPSTAALYKTWINKLLTTKKDNNLRVDFLSWHRYSAGLDDFEKDLEKISSWLNRFPEFDGIELIVSETGFNSEIDSGYDEIFGAIHTIASIAVLQRKVDRVFSFEIKDGPGGEKYWGRWGLLTHENYGEPEPKLRYKAIEFLNTMQGDTLLTLGNGTWIKGFSTKDGETIRVLIANYDRREKHFETVPITLVGIVPGEYSLKRVDFLGENRETVEIISSGQWQTIEGFEPNSASIFELTPQ